VLRAGGACVVPAQPFVPCAVCGQVRHNFGPGRKLLHHILSFQTLAAFFLGIPALDLTHSLCNCSSVVIMKISVTVLLASCLIILLSSASSSSTSAVAEEPRGLKRGRRLGQQDDERPAASTSSNFSRSYQHHRSTLAVSDIWDIVWSFFGALLKIVGFGNDDEPSTPGPTTVAPSTLAPTPNTTATPTMPPVASPTSIKKNTLVPTTLPPTSSPRSEAGAAGANNNCGCVSCTAAVWNTDARGNTCGDRIAYLAQHESHLYPDQAAACTRVARVEYPDLCGACDPLSCDGKTPPAPPATYCGCEACDWQVWKSTTDSFLSCEALITWVQTHDPMHCH